MPIDKTHRYAMLPVRQPRREDAKMLRMVKMLIVPPMLVSPVAERKLTPRATGHQHRHKIPHRGTGLETL